MSQLLLYDFFDEERAQAAYEAYYADDEEAPPFDVLRESEKLRWCMAAKAALEL